MEKNAENEFFNIIKAKIHKDLKLLYCGLYLNKVNFLLVQVLIVWYHVHVALEFV